MSMPWARSTPPSRARSSSVCPAPQPASSTWAPGRSSSRASSPATMRRRPRYHQWLSTASTLAWNSRVFIAVETPPRERRRITRATVTAFVKRLAVLLPLLAAAALVTSAAEAPAPPGPCGQAQRTGRWTQLLQSGGIKRYALVNVPPHASSSRPMPRVLVLHGAGGNGRDMDRWTGFSRVADSRGFVAVYPSAAGKFWNITASPGKADDVAYMRSLLDNVESQVCLDPDRVYATGVSNGGGMSGLLGCAMSDRLAAIAPVAGNYRPLPPCRPARPGAQVEVHG